MLVVIVTVRVVSIAMVSLGIALAEHEQANNRKPKKKFRHKVFPSRWLIVSAKARMCPVVVGDPRNVAV
jgi:hypothetical protein